MFSLRRRDFCRNTVRNEIFLSRQVFVSRRAPGGGASMACLAIPRGTEYIFKHVPAAAVFLKWGSIQGDKLFLYAHKTNVPVWLPLPEFVLEALQPFGKGDYVFWSGVGNVKSGVSALGANAQDPGKICGGQVPCSSTSGFVRGRCASKWCES
jgi:hypothetical protein